MVTMASALLCSACGATPELTFGEDGEADAAPDAGRLPTFGGPGNGDAASSPPGAVDAGAPRAVDAGPARDAASPPTVPDAASPPPPDASSPPGPLDAGAPPTIDAGPPVLACPTAPPAGADLCCGAVPCVGKKCAQVCDACAACAGRVCCATANGKSASCAATTSTCPKGNGGGNARDDADERAEVSPALGP